MTKNELEVAIASVKTDPDNGQYVLATLLGELMLMVSRHSTDIKDKLTYVSKKVDAIEERLNVLTEQLESPIYRAVLDYDEDDELIDDDEEPSPSSQD
jgi:hypothetical protein